MEFDRRRRKTHAQRNPDSGLYRGHGTFTSQDLCNDAHMKQMDEMIAKMTDEAKKKEATMHLDMSKAEMKKKDTAACMKHMNEAHKAMGM